MFELFKMNRINKLTRTHTEKISDYLILMNIVNSTDARNKMSASEYEAYCKMFQKISKRKQERYMNALQYEQRAFAIAYEFECVAGVPYAKICGGATDILYMYTNMKPKYDEIIDEMISNYSDIIESLNQQTKATASWVWSYSLSFFRNAISTIIDTCPAFKEECFTQCVCEMAYEKMKKVVQEKYYGVYEDFSKCDAIISDMHAETFRNNTILGDYIDKFTNAFLFLLSIPQNSPQKASLIDFLYELINVGNTPVEEGQHLSSNSDTSKTEFINTANKGMSEKDIQAYIDYVCKNSQMVALTREEAGFFVRNVLNEHLTNDKLTALGNFMKLKDSLKKEDKALWFAKISYFNGLLKANQVISDAEMKKLGDIFLNEYMANLANEGH